MSKSVDKMTAKELEAENRKLMKQKDEIRERQLEINAAQTRLAAREKLDALTDAERQELVQIARAEGVGSQEASGE